LFVNFLELDDHSSFFGVLIIHFGIEVTANLLVIVLETLQDQQLRDDKEDLGVTLLELLCELAVFLSGGLNNLAKME
jgi:hypothetical protein